ncbi:MAG TPA: PilZ domain-containing protein [Vicinamibacterales bacterium]|jgi:hypothetical protein|nr:PilZ domain-containing protein [Vicinamibacterales bacterium]
MSGEKRQHPRRAILIECEIDGMSGLAAPRINDLSVSGCYVESRTHATVGASIMIRLTFGGALITLTGRIAHSQPSVGFGMEFDPISADIMQAFLEPAHEQISEAHAG